MAIVENSFGDSPNAEPAKVIPRDVVRIARLCRAHSVTVMQFNWLVFFTAQLGIAISLAFGAPHSYVEELSRVVFSCGFIFVLAPAFWVYFTYKGTGTISGPLPLTSMEQSLLSVSASLFGALSVNIAAYLLSSLVPETDWSQNTLWVQWMSWLPA